VSAASRRRVVAVLGAGAAGTLTAARLAREAGSRGQGVDLLLVDPSPQTGRGVAYSADHPQHRLNVPAGRISALAERPDDFVRWLRENRDPQAHPYDFATRQDYGSYLASVLADALVASRGEAHLERVHERATGVARQGNRVRLRTGALGVRWVDAVVLATGDTAPGTAWAPAALSRSPRFLADPWQPGALARVPADQPVLLVGTGLTMVDVALALDRPGRVLHAVSRHGLLPHAHSVRPPQTVAPAPEVPDGALSADQLAQVVREHVARTVRLHGDWRPAVDSLRPVTQDLWRRLGAAERAAFVARHQRRWDVVRHRMAPAAAADLQAVRDAGRLLVRAGQVADVVEGHDGLQVTLADGQVLHVGAVVNCTGTSGDVSASHDPLLLDLLARGGARPGPLGLGLATDADGRVRAADGTAQPWLWTLGSLRRGELWESVAMPEIRVQARSVAAGVWDAVGPPPVPRRPRDPYGLPLTATPAAARSYVAALQRVLSLRAGAQAALEESVALDPDFALGHATLALVGHEWGGAVDVEQCLRQAQASPPGDERERSLVSAITSRVRRPGAAADSELLRHLGAYPEDALAVSVAVPTIAFSGATEVPQEAWTLVEGLGPVYRGDWWYTGLLAFMRQEQERWDEVGALAEVALAQEPAAGHAAHALAHLYHETGAYEQGLAWIDGWTQRHGAAAAYGSHFSWHAALYELALGRDVAPRYASSLSPSHVTGVRALVDAASLLWRCRLRGSWDGPVPIAEVLQSIPDPLLVRPPTSFLALHAAVALACLDDAARLQALAAHAREQGAPVFRDVVQPLAGALCALVEGDADRAADGLTGLQGRLAALGGSAAQREVVEDTLLAALRRAGRPDEARVLLHRRLERRASPADAAALRALGASTSA